MRLLNAFITDGSDGHHHYRMTHVLLAANPLVVPGDQDIDVEVTCGIAHADDIDYMDCPVASRWTLLRTPS